MTENHNISAIFGCFNIKNINKEEPNSDQQICKSSFALDIKKVFKQLQWWKASRRLFTSYPLLTKSCKAHRKHTIGCCMHWKHTSLCSLNGVCLLHFSLNHTGKTKMLFLKMSHPHWTRTQHGEYIECLVVGNIKVVIKQTVIVEICLYDLCRFS